MISIAALHKCGSLASIDSLTETLQFHRALPVFTLSISHTFILTTTTMPRLSPLALTLHATSSSNLETSLRLQVAITNHERPSLVHLRFESCELRHNLPLLILRQLLAARLSFVDSLGQHPKVIPTPQSVECFSSHSYSLRQYTLISLSLHRPTVPPSHH